MSSTADQVQQRVQQALHEFERLAVSDQPPTEVLKRVAELVSQTTRSTGAIVWTPQDAGGEVFAPAARLGQASSLALDENSQPPGPVLEALRKCATGNRPMAVSPDQSEFAGTQLQRATQFFIPIDSLGRIMGVLHLINEADVDPKVYRQYIAFAQQGTQAAGMYLARRQSQVLQEDAASNAALMRLSGRLLTIKGAGNLLHETANQARPLLKADRVAAVGYWGGAKEVSFSDALDTNRKAVLVRAVEALADAVRRRQVPMSFTRNQELEEEDDGLGPLLEDVWELSNAEAVCLTPMRDGDDIVGVMWAEYPTADEAGRRASTQQEISQQAGPILAQTIAWEQRPLRRTSDAIAAIKARPGSAALRALVTLTLVAAFVYLAFFRPMPLYLRGDAKLEPSEMAIVAAPAGGQVDQVNVRGGQVVRAGQVLVEMDATEFQLELQETLRAIEGERVSLDAARSEGERSDIRAASLRIEQLEVRREALERKIDRAQVRSLIDGVVLSRNTQHLEGRNVSQGETMLQVANLSSFDLVVELKESDLTLVENSLREGRAVPVSFLSRPWPDRIQQAQITDLQSLSPTSSPDEHNQQHLFRVTVSVDLQGLNPQLALANPTGRARLDVGESSAAYRYGRRVWRFIQMTLLF